MGNTEEIDYKFVDTIRLHYPALYMKSSKEYSDRDIVKNSWKGLCKRMDIEEVEVAKEWWTRLLRDYKSEKTQRQKEGRSGSGAPVKREHFRLHDLMKDMLSRSLATRRTTSNYKSKAVENCEAEEQQEDQVLEETYQQKEDCYNSKRESGRRYKKKVNTADVVMKIDETILELQKAVEVRAQNDMFDDGQENVNKDIGELIFCELQRMEKTKAEEKRTALLGLSAALEKTK